MKEVKLQMSENRDGIFSKANACRHLHSTPANTISWQTENGSECHSVLIMLKCKSKGIQLRQVIFNNTSSWATKIFICHHLIDLCPFQLFVCFAWCVPGLVGTGPTYIHSPYLPSHSLEMSHGKVAHFLPPPWLLEVTPWWCWVISWLFMTPSKKSS